VEEKTKGSCVSDFQKVHKGPKHIGQVGPERAVYVFRRTKDWRKARSGHPTAPYNALLAPVQSLDTLSRYICGDLQLCNCKLFPRHDIFRHQKE